MISIETSTQFKACGVDALIWRLWVTGRLLLVHRKGAVPFVTLRVYDPALQAV